VTFEDIPTVTGTASSDDGNGSGSTVEVRTNAKSELSFNEAMDDVWRNVEGALRSAGYHWTADSMNAWVRDKARELSAGEEF
jgi:hypothetical protein